MGAPTTWIYADELSGAAVLSSLQACRAYVSLGPQIAFKAHLAGGIHGIRADLRLQEGELELIAKVTESEEAVMLRLIHNGLVAATAPLSRGRAELALKLRLAPERPDWFRVEVSGAQGELLAISNPIFSGPGSGMRKPISAITSRQTELSAKTST